MDCPALARFVRRAVLALSLLFVLQVSHAVAGSVRLYWDANTEPDLAGYVLVWGSSPGVYTESVTVDAAVVSHEVTSLAAGTWYFAVRAFNGAGLQSGLSNEVTVSVGAAVPVPVPVPVSAPAIMAVTPSVGPTAGATSVTIAGSDFRDGVIVRFGAAGGTDVTITGADFQVGAVVRFGALTGTVTSLSATRIVARTPAQAAGAVAVTVLNPDGRSAQAPQTFSYQAAPGPTVSSFSPAVGPVTGGTDITITGANYQAGAIVRFGSAPGAILSRTATRMVVRTPAQAKGTVALTVVNPDGKGVQVPNAFTYRGKSPAVQAVSPSIGSASPP